MIKYNLKCNHNHEFESWFPDSKEFEKLKKRKLLECIYCSSKEITKSIMAPMVSVAKDRTYNLEIDQQVVKEEKTKIRKIQKYIEKNFEYVGENFSKRVREIYYDKKSNKTIYGITTPQEREELQDEGIDLISIPWADKEN